MSEHKHTPGEWVMDSSRVHTSIETNEGNHIALVSYGNVPMEEHRANARLIAEAGTVATETGLTPRQLADQRKELLEALEDLVCLAETAMHEANNDGAGYDVGGELEAARAAIAKAKGE